MKVYAQASRRELMCRVARAVPWWKWKRDPFTVDAVLMYAQRGQRQTFLVLLITPSACGATVRPARSWCPWGRPISAFSDEELLADRSVCAPEHGRAFRSGSRSRPRDRARIGTGSRFRRFAALQSAQVGACDAISADQPFALGQAAARGRPIGNFAAHAGSPGSSAEAWLILRRVSGEEETRACDRETKWVGSPRCMSLCYSSP